MAYVFWAAVVTLPLWVIYRHEGFGIVPVVVIFADLLFIVLYVRQSRFAWHVAVALNLALAIYRLVGGRQLRADIIVYTILLVYLFVLRQAYFDYINAHAT